MSSTNSRRIAGLVLIVALVAVPAANAQMTPVGVTAPVPGQIVAAKKMFISNAGSESYGSETYFRLTRYDGGPDRFYNQFYAAMKTWGRYELADSPVDADVVGEVRFTSPIVDKQSPNDLVYDPQLSLTFLDPKTRVALWSLTEHIQPARNNEGDNKNFDQAVARIVDHAKMIAAGSLSSDDERALTMTAFAPVGALETARRQERAEHTVLGSIVGGVVGSLIAVRMVNVNCGGGIGCANPEGMAMIQKGVAIGFGSMVAGGLVGWFWPTR